MSQHIDEELKSRLRRGRGNAIRQLLEGDAITASEYVLDCICAPIGDSGMVCQVAGLVEIVLHHHIDLSPWRVWFVDLPADAPEDDRLFHGKFLTALAAEEHAGCWDFLMDQLSAWQARRTLASEACDLLPAEAWLRVLPHLSDEDIQALYDRSDMMWFRLARMSARVAKVLPQAAETLGNARRPFDAKAFAEAPRSQSRFAFLRDALVSGSPSIDEELVEGLWDAHASYRTCCAEFVAIDCDAVRDRLAVLARDPWRPLAKTARRRLRPV